MKYYCKLCGEMVADTNDENSIHLGDWEEELWGHIQMEHKDKFEEVQDFETPYMIEECYTKDHNMGKLGDIVTIVVDNPYGVDDEYPVKNETGVITDFDKEGSAWEISTGMPGTSGWWYAEDEFRLATDDEIKARLKLILMR